MFENKYFENIYNRYKLLMLLMFIINFVNIFKMKF